MPDSVSQPGKSSDVLISRKAAEQALFDTNDPEHQEGVIWDSVKQTPAFEELLHVVLAYGSERYTGLGPESVAGYNGFIEGASLVLEALRRSAQRENK